MATQEPNEAAQLQQLQQQLTDAAKACDYAPGAEGYVARTNVTGIAKGYCPFDDGAQ